MSRITNWTDPQYPPPFTNLHIYANGIQNHILKVENEVKRAFNRLKLFDTRLTPVVHCRNGLGYDAFLPCGKGSTGITFRSESASPLLLWRKRMEIGLPKTAEKRRRIKWLFRRVHFESAEVCADVPPTCSDWSYEASLLGLSCYSNMQTETREHSTGSIRFG